MTRSVACLLLVAALLWPSVAPAQVPGAPREERVPDLPKDPRDDEVVRVKSILVELSAVVTDRGGAPVAGLRREDFEVFENDRPREISFFSVEGAGGASPGAGGAGVAPPATAAAAPTGSPGAAAAGRAVVLFVDTLHLTPGGLAHAKKALRRFLDEQMTERDVAAVVSTSGGGGLLGQFTRDRQLLRLAVERLHPQFAQTPSFFTPHLAAQVVREGNYEGEATALAAKIVRAEDGINAFLPAQGMPPDYPQKVYARQKATAILAETVQRRRAALATLRAVADQLARLPGQRLVAYFSEGFSLADARGETDTADVERAVSRAARSGVVIHALDARGLAPNPVFDVSAGDVSSGHAVTQLAGQLAGSVTESQNGMNALAQDTGGEAFFNSNDLGKALGLALDAGRVYYRIAYQSPGDEGGKFRRITLRLKNRPEYKVKTQRGYKLEAAREQAAETPQQKFVSALLSPLPSTAIPVVATAQFFVGAADEAQVSFRALIEAGGLDFRERPDKRLALDLETVTAVYDLSGKLVKSFPETVRSNLAPARAELLRRQGLESVKRLGLKPGLYQIRFGVRELSTERVGTSSVVVEVPDLGAGKLTLSSIFLRDDLSGATTAVAGGAGEPPRARQRHGLRLYRQGESLIYQLRIYNGAPADSGLSLQLDLRQGDKTLHTGPWQSAAPLVVARDARGVEVGGQLRVTLPPGLYELGLSVRDDRRKQTVRGSAPFAVEPAHSN
jgi:VWFA-related protein